LRGDVFLTGGTGFVGRAVLERLRVNGRRVRALARSPGSASLLRRLGAKPVAGDVLDAAALEAGMSGCDVVYHLAGLNAFCLPEPRPLYETNVVGSRNVVDAAARAGVARVVYTSSAATIGEEQGAVGAEGSRHRGWFLSDYERSKFEAERAVMARAAANGVDVVCVNPASVQGPGRTRGTARLLLAYLNGRLRAVVDARLSLVDVADCAHGHLLAEAAGRAGERYVLSGSTLSVREALTLLARVTGIDRRCWMLPPSVVLAAAGAAESVARPLARRPPICREQVRTLLHGHIYDGSRATRELGLNYTPLDETIRRTIAWYRDEGMVGRGHGRASRR
jgi:dihydroflavonol-4-reductase